MIAVAGTRYAGAQTATTPPDKPAPTPTPVVDNNPPPQQRFIHIVPFGRGAGSTTSSFPAGAHLFYWGGPVISSVHVVVVFWGPNVNPALTANGTIDQFFTDITQSRFYDLLTEYGTVGVTGQDGGSSNQSINRGIFDGKFTITPSTSCPPSCILTDDQIQAELNSQINAGHLPQPVKDGQGNIVSFYMTYFPPGINILAAGSQSCVSGGFCAYHSNHRTALFQYGVLPDFAPPSLCSQGCGRGTLFDNVTAVTSHEMSEAVTDPQVGSAVTVGPPLAWYDQSFGEIGDICAPQDVAVAAGQSIYVIQKEFSNLQGDCVSQPPTFLLTAPSSLGPGISTNMTLAIKSSVTFSNLTNYRGTVHFTSSDAQAVLAADYTFTAGDAGTHTFSFTLNTLGAQSITATDTSSAGFTGTAAINVNHAADLTITKSHVGDFAQTSTGDYTITVSNRGNGPTTGTVSVTDTLPTGLTGTAMAGPGWTCNLGTLTCTRSDALPSPGSYPAITLMVSVAANASPNLVNAATVSGGGEINTANDTATDFTVIGPPPVPDLSPGLVGNGIAFDTFFQGEIGATYTLSVANIGTGATTGPITIVDTLPAGLTATAISGQGWNCTLATLTCTRNDFPLAPGAGYPWITLTVNVAINAPSNLISKATVSGGGETNTSNDTTTDFTLVVPPPAPDLSVVTGHTQIFRQGTTGATYFVGVTNVGDLPTSGVVTVTDSLTTGLTATAISGSGWTCDLPTTTCSRSDVLAPNSSYSAITVTVNVASNAPALVTNSATVSGGGDSTPGNNTANNETQVVPGFNFLPVTPCRIADTRLANGPFGGPFLSGQSVRSFTIPSGDCNIPTTAQAFSLNVTVVPHGQLGFLTTYPCDQAQPVVSTLNSDGRIKAVAAIVPAGATGAVCFFVTNDTDLVLDIDGYFVANDTANSLAFYPVTPCRLVDTRLAAGPLGGPSLAGNVVRTLPILSSPCNLPGTAQAYSLNYTSVPKGPLGFLATWPAGQPQPVVSTLNAPTGAITANAAIVPAGASGSVSVLATNNSDLVIDVNGYFAPPGAGGLSLFNLTPCRVLDTRNVFNAQPFTGEKDISVATISCGAPAFAQSFVLNSTVVPPAGLSFLTMWPQGGTQPTVSTLNAGDGAITSNMALVPTTNGSVSAFASNPSHLVLDISGYFLSTISSPAGNGETTTRSTQSNVSGPNASPIPVSATSQPDSTPAENATVSAVSPTPSARSADPRSPTMGAQVPSALVGNSIVSGAMAVAAGVRHSQPE
jgi:uncharacterized repeat protein (TIGR01451 family)